MPKPNWLVRAAVVALGAVLMAGLIQLLRFSSGDSYAPFSSMSSDPTGTKVLFDALQKTGKIGVTRQFRALGEWHAHEAAVFYLGITPAALATIDEPFLAKTEQLAEAGNRVVLGIDDSKKPEPAPATKKNSAQKKSVIERRWDLSPALLADGLERPFGNGAILLLRHAERLENKPLVSEPDNQQLALTLIAGKSSAVFEEAHLGLVETGSVAGLARRYRLQGLLVGLLLLAALFLWSRSVSFPPPRADAAKEIALEGSDSRAVFVDLLARHIPAESLLEVCVAEWNRANSTRQIVPPGTTRSKDLASAYRRLQESLPPQKQ